MANELKHKSVGTSLTRAEFEAIDGHEADGQTANDMLYFNGTYWIRATPTAIATVLGIDAKAVAAVEAAGLILAAAKKIVIPIDGVLELVANTGNCLLFGGRNAYVPFELMVQPASGDNMGGINVAPSGTENKSSFTMLNASDFDNFGYLELGLVGSTASLFPSNKGTGTKPTLFQIMFPLSMYNKQITNLAAPIASSDAARKIDTPQIVRKTADETVNNSTTLQNDDHLTFAIAANEVWLVEYFLLIISNVTPDSKFGFAYPSGCNIDWRAVNYWGNAAASLLSETDTEVKTSGGAVLSGMKLVAIVANGATAGNITLQWAQNTADPTDTTVKANSCLIAHKLA